MSAAKQAVLDIASDDEAATLEIAATLARECKSGDCLMLRGDLGAGKTTFARGFIQALQLVHEEVVSPTFTLVQTYPARGATVWHFDLYRLKTAAEAREIGLHEALEDGITLIEWPELVESELPASALSVTMRLGNHAGQRLITFSGSQQAWQDRLKKMKA